MTAPYRVAVVVGVGDVVGRACAVGLVQHVEVVVVIDPSEPAAKQAAVAVEEAGGEAMRHAADLTDLVAMERAAEAVVPALTQVMAHELAPLGIRVNCVARAAVEDPSVVAAAPVLHGDAMACTPLGRPARGEEVARVVSFLAGADASYVTGSTLVVDGGRSGLTPGTAVRTQEAP